MFLESSSKLSNNIQYTNETSDGCAPCTLMHFSSTSLANNTPTTSKYHPHTIHFHRKDVMVCH